MWTFGAESKATPTKVTSFSLLRLLLLWSVSPRTLRLQQLWLMGSVVVNPRLQSTGLIVVRTWAHGSELFLAQGTKPVSPTLASRFSTTGPPGKPSPVMLVCCITDTPFYAHSQKFPHTPFPSPYAPICKLFLSRLLTHSQTLFFRSLGLLSLWFTSLPAQNRWPGLPLQFLPFEQISSLSL